MGQPGNNPGNESLISIVYNDQSGTAREYPGTNPGTYTGRSSVSAIDLRNIGDTFFPNYPHLEWVEQKTPEVKMSYFGQN